MGLISKKRGAIGNHRLPEGLKEVSISLTEEKYPDFGPTLAQEKLIEIAKPIILSDRNTS
jgi:hypothetical protein